MIISNSRPPTVCRTGSPSLTRGMNAHTTALKAVNMNGWTFVEDQLCTQSTKKKRMGRLNIMYTKDSTLWYGPATTMRVPKVIATLELTATAVMNPCMKKAGTATSRGTRLT